MCVSVPHLVCIEIDYHHFSNSIHMPEEKLIQQDTAHNPFHQLTLMERDMSA